MDEVLNAPFVAQEGAIGNWKLIRKVGLDESSDEKAEGAVGGTNGDPFQGERTRCQAALRSTEDNAYHTSPSGDAKREYPFVGCPNCARRLEMAEENQERELELLKTCWDELSQTVLHMFRDGLTVTFTSLKGKPIDVHKVKRNVAILASKDPHQLYMRLASIGHKHVMSLKSDNWWQLLVEPGSIELFHTGASKEKLELERAKLFIKSLLNRFSSQQETVRNMSPLLATLDEDYLHQFGISWTIINHHIFDTLIYQDNLLLNYLPSMEKVLNCELILTEESDEERQAREKREMGRLDIPSWVLQLAQGFRAFHKLMISSRVIFDKTSANIALYVEQQCMIRDMRKNAKVQLGQEDGEFCKSQRRLMRNCASSKHYIWREDLTPRSNIERLFNFAEENTNSEADAAEFSKRLHKLMDEASAACIDENGKLAPSMQCKECSVRHCSCDECRIWHVNTCGLLGQCDGLTTDLVSNKSSTDVSENNEKESDSEAAQHCNKSLSCSRPKSPSVHRALRFQAARALLAMHDQYKRNEIAWGDRQAPYSLPHDVDLEEHCLNNPHQDTHSCPHSELFDNNPRLFKDGLLDIEAFEAVVTDMAGRMGYDIQETVIGKARKNETSLKECCDKAPLCEADRHKLHDMAQRELVVLSKGMQYTLSDKLECKCEDGKRMASCEAKEEFMNNHSGDESDDITDDDYSTVWSECEPIDEASVHPHRHHSCENKGMAQKKERGARKDNGGMHCDCCCCEMFGHSAVDSFKLGRAPQMRERLRQKLNRRNHQQSQSKSGMRQDKKEVAEEGGRQEVALPSVDEILEFINEKDTAAAQAAANKAAKRVRKKQRKQEDKERVEMERRKQEEARRLQKEEEERVKYEKRAAQQAASKKRALKAAEDRARAHKRQKELREQERLQQKAKEQQRVFKAQAARRAALDAEEAARKAKAELEALHNAEAVRRAKVEEAVRRAKAEQQAALKLKMDEQAARMQTLREEEARKERLKEEVCMQKLQGHAACLERIQELTAERERLGGNVRKAAHKVEVIGRANEAFLMADSDQTVMKSTSKVVHTKTSSGNLFERWEGEPRSPSAPSRMNVSSHNSPQKTFVLPSTLYDRERSVLDCIPPSSMHLIHHPTSLQLDSQGLFDAFTTPPPDLAPRSLSAQAKPVHSPQMDYAGTLPPSPFSYVPFEANPYLYATNGPYYHPPCSVSPLSTLTQPQSAFEMPVHSDPTPQPCKQFNDKYLTTPCSSSSSTPALSYPYGDLMCGNALRIGEGYVSGLPSTTSLHHAEPHPLHTVSTVFPPLDAYPYQTQSALLNFNDLPTNTAQMSSASMVAHKPATNPMAAYESETKALTAMVEQENARRPLVYELGDPRITTAVAPINNDPHDTSKPRPDTELLFLDSNEQEIERFKRVMWEARSNTWSRLPSGNLPGIDPENEENAVFHFDPLV